MIEALQARGHMCTAAVPGRRAAGFLEDLCEVIRAPEGFRRRVAPAGNHDFAHISIYDLEMAMSIHQRDLEVALRASVAYVAGAVTATRPDLVVVDQITVAQPVARASGIPVVQVSSAPMLPGHGPWMSWLPGPDPAFRYPAALPPLRRAFASVGLRPPASLDEQLEGDLVLVPSLPALGSAPGAVHVCPADALGPLTGPGAPAPHRAGRGRPVVAINLSTSTRLLGEGSIAGVLDAGADALVIDAAAELPAALVERDGVTVVGTVDLPRVLASCDAVLHHGGAGTAMAGLVAGVPAVVVPGTSEQEHNGRRLAALGAAALVTVRERPPDPYELRPGLVTLAHRRPERLGERVAEALGGMLARGDEAARARELGAQLRALPPIESAVEAIEGTTMGRAA